MSRCVDLVGRICSSRGLCPPDLHTWTSGSADLAVLAVQICRPGRADLAGRDPPQQTSFCFCPPDVHTWTSGSADLVIFALQICRPGRPGVQIWRAETTKNVFVCLSACQICTPGRPGLQIWFSQPSRSAQPAYRSKSADLDAQLCRSGQKPRNSARQICSPGRPGLQIWSSQTSRSADPDVQLCRSGGQRPRNYFL